MFTIIMCIVYCVIDNTIQYNTSSHQYHYEHYPNAIYPILIWVLYVVIRLEYFCTLLINYLSMVSYICLRPLITILKIE